MLVLLVLVLVLVLLSLLFFGFALCVCVAWAFDRSVPFFAGRYFIAQVLLLHKNLPPRYRAHLSQVGVQAFKVCVETRASRVWDICTIVLLFVWVGSILFVLYLCCI